MSPKPGEQVAFLTEFSSGPSKTPLIRGHRSKGCMTCRRRKVKCDERRPTCERCEKGFHKCLGYDKPLVFVQHSGQAGGSSKGQPLESPTVVTPSEQGSEEWNIICFDQSKPSTSEAETQVPQTMQLNAFQDEIVISHLLESFQVGFGDRFTRGTDAPTWRRILTTGKGKSNAYVAGLGLAEAFFGKVHKMNSLVQHSAKLYGQALRSLRDDLQLVDNDLGHDKAYMNLWNSTFLVLYELVASGNTSSWLQHARGVAALTNILGPEAFQTPIANSMLETFRTTITISSIAQRKYCFLADEEWKTIPWAREDVPKSVTSKINDVMCDVPGLMESVDALHELESQGLDAEYRRVPLQNRILTTLQKLMALRWQWEFANSRACWAEPIDMLTTSSVDMQGKPLFDTVLRYEFFDQAVNIVYFNAIRLMLYGLQDGAGLEDEFVSAVLETGPPGPHSNALLLPGQGDRLDHILEICRSVDYCLQASLEYQGALQLLFPLRVAHGYASYLDPKLATWIGKILVQLATSNGFQIGKHVLEMGRYPPPKLPVRQ